MENLHSSEPCRTQYPPPAPQTLIAQMENESSRLGAVKANGERCATKLSSVYLYTQKLGHGIMA